MAKTGADTSPAFSLLPHDALVRALAETQVAAPFPTIDDRDAWERIAGTAHGAIIREAALAAAERHAETPGVRAPTLTEFLTYTRTGDRRTWEAAAGAFSQRLDAFTLAACFTGESRWVEKAADALWALCELTSWVTPAHEGAQMPDPEFPVIDLWAAMRAQDVAETLQVLGPAFDRIDPRIRRRALAELDRRVFDPFLARSDWWWLWKQPGRFRLNNWTAVCSGGVLLGALAALNDAPQRQAQIVHKAAWSLGFFVDTFDEAGSLDEGAGYWSYGVSYFVMAAERLAARTGGQTDLLADPLWREIAQFPLRVRLYGDTFVNFSDCAPTVRPVPGWLAWMGRRLDVPGLVSWADRLAGEESAGFGTHHRHFPFALRTLFWMETAPSPAMVVPVPEAEAAVYLPDVQWLLARADASDDALILAAKGGHNAENHNHNDGGSFLVHYRQEALVAEIGTPTYTRQFFSATRYENIAARSLGHSVPLVNGQEQRAGRAFAAQVLAQNEAALSLELAGLYPPEAKIVSLRRDLALHGNAGGGSGKVTLSDTATFAEDGATLGLPLIALDTEVAVAEPGRARITGKRGRLEIIWDPAQATCRAEDVLAEDPKFADEQGRPRIRRLYFDVTVTGRDARLDLTLTPTALEETTKP